ncbi:MAG: glycoside hydrolase, partial [Cyanobacteriota bacterium]
MSGEKKFDVYLTIHGHFYQPPRENPWLEYIEEQGSAAPFHDWNARIDFECYSPNSVARITDLSGKILDIVNNYSLISYNFGPTLLTWLEQNSPNSYKRILDADKYSQSIYSGHGNAIAQVYNHIIMPLANYNDKVTQVYWGIKDFEYRFG